MAHAPNTIKVARRVRRRVLLGSLIRRGGVGLALGSAVGLSGVLAGRLGWLGQGWGDRWLWVLGGGVAAGLMGGGLAGLVGRWSVFAAAQRADRVLGLRDRLSNALSFATRDETHSPAEQLAIREAERVAASLPVKNVVPVRFGSAWAIWPVVIAAAVACGVWVPEPAPKAREVSHAASEPERRAAADVIAEAARDAREAAEATLKDRAADTDLARMDEIERELLDGSRDPGEALAEGSRQIDALADRVEQEAQTEALADQRAREQLAEQVEAGEGASELAKALSEGDLEGARRAAAEMMDRADRMSPEEREKYASELDRLAEQLDRTPQRDEPEPGDAAMQETLREQGIDEPESLGDSVDPGELQERLEEQGVEPDAARDMAEELAKRNREKEAQERAREEIEELTDAAREAAEELREKPPAPEQPREAPDGSADQEQQPSAQEGQEPGQDEQGREGQTDQPGAEQGDQQERTQDGQQDGQQDGEQGQEQDQQDGQGQKQDQGAAEKRPGDEGTDPSKQPGQQPGQQPTQQQGDETGTPTGEPTRQDGEGNQPGQQQVETQGTEPDPGAGEELIEPGEDGAGAEDGNDSPTRMTDGSGDAPEGSGIERLRKQLERMAERGKGAQEQQDTAEDLREMARRLLEQTSPEERQELEQLARDMMGEDDGEGADGRGRRSDAAGARAAPEQPWDSESFDARSEPSSDEPGGGQVIADWLGNDDDQSVASGDGGTPGASSGQVLQEAARGAERAVERQAVPRERRDLVRRVFERFRQRAAKEREAASEGTGGS